MADSGGRIPLSGLYTAPEPGYAKYQRCDSAPHTCDITSCVPYISHLAFCSHSNPPHISETAAHSAPRPASDPPRPCKHASSAPRAPPPPRKQTNLAHSRPIPGKTNPNPHPTPSTRPQNQTKRTHSCLKIGGETVFFEIRQHWLAPVWETEAEAQASAHLKAPAWPYHIQPRHPSLPHTAPSLPHTAAPHRPYRIRPRPPPLVAHPTPADATRRRAGGSR